MIDLTDIGLNEICKKCGCAKVRIRGQHPNEDKRVVCPACLADENTNARNWCKRFLGQNEASAPVATPNAPVGDAYPTPKVVKG